MNHHDEYKMWTLALWIARDLPTAHRRKNPKDRTLTARTIRHGWLLRFEDKHGPQPKLRQLVKDIYGKLYDGEIPSYNGPFQESLRGIPPCDNIGTSSTETGEIK